MRMMRLMIVVSVILNTDGDDVEGCEVDLILMVLVQMSVLTIVMLWCTPVKLECQSASAIVDIAFVSQHPNHSETTFANKHPNHPDMPLTPL